MAAVPFRSHEVQPLTSSSSSGGGSSRGGSSGQLQSLLLQPTRGSVSGAFSGGGGSSRGGFGHALSSHGVELQVGSIGGSSGGSGGGGSSSGSGPAAGLLRASLAGGCHAVPCTKGSGGGLPRRGARTVCTSLARRAATLLAGMLGKCIAQHARAHEVAPSLGAFMGAQQACGRPRRGSSGPR